MKRREMLSALALISAIGCASETSGDNMEAIGSVGGGTTGGNSSIKAGDPVDLDGDGDVDGKAVDVNMDGIIDGVDTDGDGDVDAPLPSGSSGGGMMGTGGGSTPDGGASTGGGGSTGGGSTGSVIPPLPTSCGGKTKANVNGPAPTFKRNEISKQAGAAYMRPADVDGDGFPEILLSSLATGVSIGGAIGGGSPLTDGAAYLLKRNGGKPTGTLGTWEAKEIFGASAKVSFPNESEYFDVDGDGIKDWMIGAGFLIKPAATIPWMKGAAGGAFGTPNFVAIPDKACWYHSTLPIDLDADGDNDFITSCHVGTTQNIDGPSRMEWFENDGKGTFKHHAIAEGGGAIIHLYDLDEDGDQDIVAPQYFSGESIVWFEQTGAKGATWAKHVINNTTGAGFIARFADMNGDGRIDMVYGNHNNQKAAAPKNKMGIYWFEIPSKDQIRTLANWDAQMHTVFEGFNVAGPVNQAGAPGVINVGDIDGDCDIDITASGDGDTGLYLFVQQNGKFEKVDLFVDASNENSGEQHMIDLDGDGDLDIIWAVFGPAGIASAISGINSHVYAFLQD